jgi:uncharacterized protein (TIGR03084 family)
VTFQQPYDFKAESDALYELVKDLSDEELAQATQFKNWTIENVIGHLHMWNWAADKSLNEPEKFDEFYATVQRDIAGGLRPFEDKWLDGLKGRKLVAAWHDFYTEMAERFAKADPKARVKWAGPDMSVRSSITARLMETWAHGQEVYDRLGVVRKNEDRIRNIAVLGINTFGWTFVNRGEEVPEPMPYVKLTAPSGEIWEWGDPANEDRVEGSAEEFCQVVTQTRNFADTNLKATGPIATRWMEIAQCFAGPPETPPAKGKRHTVAA